MNIEKEIEKLKFQIQTIGETIDYEQYPLQELIISFDWSRENLNQAHDIFEKHDKKLNETEKFNSAEFEHELRDAFSIGYQEVKSIINAFYRNGQWTSVCMIYALENMVVEFHDIQKDYNKHVNAIKEILQKSLESKFEGLKTLKEIFNNDRMWDNIDLAIKLPFKKQFYHEVEQKKWKLIIDDDLVEDTQYRCV
jgi:hypothetical protein